MTPSCPDRRQCDFPGVRCLQRPVRDPHEQRGLFRIPRLCVGEEHDVAQPHRTFAVVLGQLVLGELPERLRQSELHLLGQRPLAVTPVERHQFGDLVGASDGFGDRVRDARSTAADQIEKQHQRRVAQPVNGACFHSQRRHGFAIDRCGVLDDTVSDVLAVLIELVLPQQARQNRTAKSCLRRDVLGRRTFMGAADGNAGRDVQAHRSSPLFIIASDPSGERGNMRKRPGDLNPVH